MTGTLPSVLLAAILQQPDFEWITVGDPGNRGATAEEAPAFDIDGWEEAPIGRVAHVFRITCTEITVEQWLPFVEAYAPHWDGSAHDSNFIGFWILENAGEYSIVPGTETFPTTMEWRVAARFCNWMHNGRVSEPWAFEQGAYDTSTFGNDDDGTMLDKTVPAMGARFWIPTIHEWTKAAHYDPNRYGSGKEGYWRYPNSSDIPSTPGWPWDGGETDASEELWGGPPLDVGSYPDVTSVYGLVDLSGSVGELTTTRIGSSHVFARESEKGTPTPNDEVDGIDYFAYKRPFFGGSGIRLVAQSPCAPDCNWDGQLNVLDFVCFQGLLATADHTADRNFDGSLDILDVLAFQEEFADGCQ